MSDYFEKNITELKGVGDARAKLFGKLGVDTVGSLLCFYPRDYEDWGDCRPLIDASASPDEPAFIKGRIIAPAAVNRVRAGMTLYTFRAADDNGSVFKIVFFNNTYIERMLRVDGEYVFHGKVSFDYTIPQMNSPEFLPFAQCGGLVPIYHQTEGLSSRMIAQTVKAALSMLPDPLTDPVPADIRVRYGLCHLLYALQQIHRPDSLETLETARRRLIFDELLLLQLGLITLRERRSSLYSGEREAARMSEDRTEEFLSSLPFEPTGAQRRAVSDCVRDMMSGGGPMSRLVQGDVGSGKTVVAAALCYSCAKCGMQSALMVPTEILAEQHYGTLSKLLEGTGVSVRLLTGSLSAAAKKEVYSGLADGSVDIAVGTHALISEGVVFNALGLVITDEQHRFGVAQRARLASKGRDPHMLVMSATPIPRTLALIMFGDLDVSVIDEMPRGRLPVKTYWIDESKRERAYGFIRKQLDEGNQAFIVCPLVGQSDMELASAEETAAKLASDAFYGYRVGLLHGKMKPADKEYVMRRFAAGETQLLVSTTVVEVGVDVPNATVMFIENAERFGLSQLHQLRGRVGRGGGQAYCILLCNDTSRTAAQRMKVMTGSSDGFVIAREDLKLRGPGDFFGSRQHGLPDLKLADLSGDIKTLEETQCVARELLASDPELSASDHEQLRRQMERLFKDYSIFN